MALASSSTSSATALSSALSEFQASLSDDRKMRLRALRSVPRATDVLAFTADLDRANAVRKRRGVASRFCTLLQSIQQYAAVMDTYSQVKADTTSLIWGSLKLCIHVASSAASYYDKLSEWFMRLGTLCPRLSEWHSLFPHDARLQRALDAFYATVIRFCTRAVQVLDRTGVMNFVSTLWKPFEVEFAALEKDLKQQRADIDEEIRLSAAQVAIQERNDAARFRESFTKNFTMWRSADEARIKTLDLAKSLTEKERLLDRFSSHDYQATLKENRKKRHGSTCSWLMTLEQYKGWRDDAQSSLFWLSGGVGSGKSVLSAAVIDDLLRNTVNSSATVSFFFCKENIAESVRAATILRSLIRQCFPMAEYLLEQQRAELSRFFSENNSVEEPGEAALTKLFIAALSRINASFVVIDGFDECSMAEQCTVLQVLNGIPAALGASSIKVFFASGGKVGEGALTAFASRYHYSVSRGHVDADIAAYVTETLQMKVGRGELLVGSPEKVDEVQHALVDGADGMFLWVAFQIQDICEQSCDDDIRRVIMTLPRGLRETYERILVRIGQRGRAGVAEKVFHWTAAVRRPLTLDELHEAVSVEPGQESFRHDRLANGFKAHMVSWCGNLVTVDEETRAVQFAHPTVKEYLLDHNADDTVAAPAAVNRFHFRPDDADIVVGEVCVTYLCFSDFERQLVKTSKLDLSVKPAALASASLSASGISSVAKGLAQLERWRNGSRPAKLDNLVHLENARRIDRMAARQDKFHFLPYATECWVAHTRYITENARTWRQFLRLVLTDSHFASLWSLLQAGNDMKRLVHDITEYCHGALLSSIYRFRPQFVAGQLDDLFRACCERRLPDLAMICLDIAEEVKVVHDEWLLFTAKWNAPQLTKRLLSMGVQVGTRGQDPNGALLLAVQGGHVDVFRELLAAGRYSYEDLGGKHVAENQVDRLDFKIVEMLLDAGSTFDALPAPDLKLAVAREAATSGQLELVEKLIGAGAYASGDERRPDGSTLLIAAIADRRFQLADNLIHMGASVNLSAYGDGQTALHVAVDVENAGTVQSLISMGAYVDAVSRKPGEPSALHTAVYRGNVEIVDLLLDAEAEINAWTTATLPPAALERFAAAGRLDLVEEFVVAGARIPINETPCNGSPLLVAAIEGRQFQLAGHLIDIGAHVNIEASDHGGRTPIQVAASTGSIEIVRRLLEAGANVNSEPAKYGGRTALQAAVEAGHLATVRLLLRSGADVNASPAFHDGKTAIEAAIASRNLFLVETLMLAGAPLSKDEAWHSGWTLLQAAAKACRVKLIQRLLLLGADVNARPADDAGQTALQAAASAGDRETVKLLLDAGANVNAPPAEYGGLTALQAAAAAGDMGTVELLLNAGAHVNGLPANPRGRTALQAAAEAGQREVAELLLAVGADVNASAANCGGLTALQAAAESGQQNIVELLLHAGADVNAAPAEFAGSTALEAAVQAGHEEVVRLLLDAVRQM